MDGIANVKALKQNQFGMSENSEKCVVAGAESVRRKDIKDKVREAGKGQIRQRILDYLCPVELAATMKMFHTLYCPKQ